MDKQLRETLIDSLKKEVKNIIELTGYQPQYEDEDEFKQHLKNIFLFFNSQHEYYRYQKNLYSKDENDDIPSHIQDRIDTEIEPELQVEMKGLFPLDDSLKCDYFKNYVYVPVLDLAYQTDIIEPYFNKKLSFMESFRYKKEQGEKFKEICKYLSTYPFCRIDNLACEIDDIINRLLILMLVKWSSEPGDLNSSHLRRICSDYCNFEGYVFTTRITVYENDDIEIKSPWYSTLKSVAPGDVTSLNDKKIEQFHIDQFKELTDNYFNKKRGKEYLPQKIIISSFSHIAVAVGARAVVLVDGFAVFPYDLLFSHMKYNNSALISLGTFHRKYEINKVLKSTGGRIEWSEEKSHALYDLESSVYKRYCNTYIYQSVTNNLMQNIPDEYKKEVKLNEFPTVKNTIKGKQSKQLIIGKRGFTFPTYKFNSDIVKHMPLCIFLIMKKLMVTGDLDFNEKDYFFNFCFRIGMPRFEVVQFLNEYYKNKDKAKHDARLRRVILVYEGKSGLNKGLFHPCSFPVNKGFCPFSMQSNYDVEDIHEAFNDFGLPKEHPIYGMTPNKWPGITYRSPCENTGLATKETQFSVNGAIGYFMMNKHNNELIELIKEKERINRNNKQKLDVSYEKQCNGI